MQLRTGVCGGARCASSGPGTAWPGGQGKPSATRTPCGVSLPASQAALLMRTQLSLEPGPAALQAPAAQPGPCLSLTFLCISSLPDPAGRPAATSAAHVTWPLHMCAGVPASASCLVRPVSCSKWKRLWALRRGRRWPRSMWEPARCGLHSPEEGQACLPSATRPRPVCVPGRHHACPKAGGAKVAGPVPLT